MENLLGVMMRLKNVRNLDSRHAAAVDSAYFANKPARGGTPRRRRPPLHEYVRHLVFEVRRRRRRGWGGACIGVGGFKPVCI